MKGISRSFSFLWVMVCVPLLATPLSAPSPCVSMVTVETPRQLLLKTTFSGYFAGLLVVEMPTDIVMCLGNETLASNATVALDLLT